MTIELDFSKLSGTDVLDMAIAIEDEAQVYYEQLAGWVGDDNLRATAAFLEDFTARGRVPGDHLSALFDEDPGRALAWAASEP